jgi:hypothetical protein
MTRSALASQSIVFFCRYDSTASLIATIVAAPSSALQHSLPLPLAVFFRGFRWSPPIRWCSVPPLIYFPKLELSMRLHLLRQLAIIATPILLLAPAPPLRLSARADDAPKTAHEAAVLDRIFANWKARHDRVRTLHFTIDSRTVYKKGQPDPSRFGQQTRLDRDQLFQQFGVQIWIEGDDRICVVTTPTFKVPQAKLTETNRVDGRWVQVGQTISIFAASPGFETGVAPPKFAPYGYVFRNPGRDWPLADPFEWPLLLTYRPQARSMNWLRDQCRLVDENSLVEGGRSLMFQRAVEPSDNAHLRRDEACWVSPARDDVVVHWRIETARRKIEGSVKHKKDETFGWVPAEWTVGTKGVSGFFAEYAVVKYELNKKIDPAVFSQSFPAGTPVQEEAGSGAARKVRCYVVQPDGSERAISPEQYDRLAGF